MNIGLLLDMAADGLGDAAALTSPGGSRSYAALRADADKAATWMACFAVDHIAYVGGNLPAFPIALFAAAKLGRPFAPINYRLPDADLRKILGRTAPGLAIVEDEHLGRIGTIEGVTIIPLSSFMDAIAGTVAQPLAEPETDIAVLLFTSGTTGEPKAAILKHQNLASYVIATVEFMAAAENEQATLVSVPPYHIAGISAVLTSIYSGRRIVQLPQFTPEAWIALAEQERVTHAMVVPTMLGRIAEAIGIGGAAPGALRHLSYGGGRMPPSLIERALDLMPNVAFVNAYGLTETSSTIAILTPDDHRTFHRNPDDATRRRLGSVGQPLPSVELRITGPNGALLPPGRAGEIWVRGAQVSGEYVGHRAVRDDGWFPTKDLGWIDEDGYLFIDGRLDDVIVRGGENISPGEIEDVLRAHPAVRDVAVVGIPDETWGERIAAVVVASPPPAPDELQQWVRQRLRSTKTPEIVCFRDALPYNETGKLLRRILRAELSAPEAIRRSMV